VYTFFCDTGRYYSSDNTESGAKRRSSSATSENANAIPQKICFVADSSEDASRNSMQLFCTKETAHDSGIRRNLEEPDSGVATKTSDSLASNSRHLGPRVFAPDATEPRFGIGAVREVRAPLPWESGCTGVWLASVPTQRRKRKTNSHHRVGPDVFTAGDRSAKQICGLDKLKQLPESYHVLHNQPLLILHEVEETNRAIEQHFLGEADNGVAAKRVNIVGLDVEIKPTWTPKAPRRKIALIQIASMDVCVLVHVHKMGQVPIKLQQLLEDDTVLKVGTQVAGDLQMIEQDFGFRPCGFVDNKVLAEVFQYERVGLKNMAAEFGMHITKSRKVQCSNWEEFPLSSEQVAYAAMDARLSLWLLKEMHAKHATEPSGLYHWCQNVKNFDSVLDLVSAVAGDAARQTFLSSSQWRLNPTFPPSLLLDVQAFQQKYQETKRRQMIFRSSVKWRAKIEQGLESSRSALIKLHELATLAGAKLDWTITETALQEAPSESKSRKTQIKRSRFTITPILAGRLLYPGVGPTLREARSHAALESIRKLSTEPVSVWIK